MNHRGGWALIKRSWLSWMQYRSFFFLLAFGWMIPPLIYLFVWSTRRRQHDDWRDDRPASSGYYLVLILVNQFTYSQTNWTVGDVIRIGRPEHLAAASDAAALQRPGHRGGRQSGYHGLRRARSPWLLALVLRPELHTDLGEMPLRSPRADPGLAAALSLGLLAGPAGLLDHSRRCSAGLAGFTGLSPGGHGRPGAAAAGCPAAAADICPSATWSAFRSRS